MKISTILIGMAGATLLVTGIAFGFHHRQSQNPVPNDTAARAQNPAPSSPSAATGGDTAREPAAVSGTPDTFGGTTVKVAMKNVDFHLTDRIVVHIASLQG